jgi:hypothetical protein
MTDLLTRDDLVAMTPYDLEGVFWQGHTPQPEELIGWEFEGYNHPKWVEPLGFRKFKKGFFKGNAEGASFEGFNIDVIQNGLDGEWLGKPADDNPKRYGFYIVDRVHPTSPDNKYPHSLLIDYGASPRNPWYDVTKRLRDYLVRVQKDNPDLYLGKAYLALGPLRVATSFFILRRLREHDFNG